QAECLLAGYLTAIAVVDQPQVLEGQRAAGVNQPALVVQRAALQVQVHGLFADQAALLLDQSLYAQAQVALGREFAARAIVQVAGSDREVGVTADAATGQGVGVGAVAQVGAVQQQGFGAGDGAAAVIQRSAVDACIALADQLAALAVVQGAGVDVQAQVGGYQPLVAVVENAAVQAQIAACRQGALMLADAGCAEQVAAIALVQPAEGGLDLAPGSDAALFAVVQLGAMQGIDGRYQALVVVVQLSCTQAQAALADQLAAHAVVQRAAEFDIDRSQAADPAGIAVEQLGAAQYYPIASSQQALALVEQTLHGEGQAAVADDLAAGVVQLPGSCDAHRADARHHTLLVEQVVGGDSHRIVADDLPGALVVDVLGVEGHAALAEQLAGVMVAQRAHVNDQVGLGAGFAAATVVEGVADHRQSLIGNQYTASIVQPLTRKRQCGLARQQA
uniref:NAD-specific glutamate dehydrogenase n=1 Tax=Steinernema glaseri TaxID=37863 RepID=A0A1I8ANL1_9BILA